MNTEKQIEDFNITNAPFYVVAHDDGRFSLCLPIALLSDEYYPYCQTAFDNYAKGVYCRLQKKENLRLRL